MPSNPNKEDLRARRNLNLIMNKALPQAGEMLFSDVVRECLLNFEVSRKMVEDFIKDFYVTPGYVKLEDGVLIAKKEGADGGA